MALSAKAEQQSPQLTPEQALALAAELRILHDELARRSDELDGKTDFERWQPPISEPKERNA